MLTMKGTPDFQDGYKFAPDLITGSAGEFPTDLFYMPQIIHKTLRRL